MDPVHTIFLCTKYCIWTICPIFFAMQRNAMQKSSEVYYENWVLFLVILQEVRSV